MTDHYVIQGLTRPGQPRLRLAVLEGSRSDRSDRIAAIWPESVRDTVAVTSPTWVWSIAGHQATFFRTESDAHQFIKDNGLIEVFVRKAGSFVSAEAEKENPHD